MASRDTATTKKIKSPMRKREAKWFYIFILPWILGFFLFTFFPMAMSAVLSFMKWDYVQAPRFVGWENFITLFHDDVFYKSLQVTIIYAVFSVPLSLLVSFIFALLLNTGIKGLSVYRTLFYLPSLVSGAAASILWMWMFNPEFGVINTILGYFGIDGPGWIYDKNWALPALIIMSLWGVGGSMLIYLSGLQGIPTELYEAAKIDGSRKSNNIV